MRTTCEQLRNDSPVAPIRSHRTATLTPVIARRLTAFAAAGTIVLAACAGGGDSDAQVETETPVEEPAPQPADEPAAEPAGEPAGEPAAEPADEPVEEPATEPAGEPADEPAAEPVEEPAGEPAAEPAPSPTEAPVAVPEILDVSATTIDGNEIELGAFAGRPVLLWFWAPW